MAGANLNPPTESPLARALDEHTIKGTLWRPEGERIRCFACGHRCLIAKGKRGICKVRFNDEGILKVPFGYVAGVQADPVEKKPFFHFLPGSIAFTFGMLGCDLHCSYCQNWVTSQALRDEFAGASIRPVSPEELVRLAVQTDAAMMVSSYNEPLITAEWAVEVFRHAKAQNLPCAFVSNGNLTPEVLEFLRPWIVAYKIDLKTFQDQHYRALGGTLEKIVEGIRMVHRSGLWLELVTLLIPGFNNSDEELKEMTAFIASVDKDIPWHVTAFHPDYKMTGPRGTVADDLQRAADIGREAGLRYIYAGNLPGQTGDLESTRCPSCGHTLVKRRGYRILSRDIGEDGRCPQCLEAIPGLWHNPLLKQGQTLLA